MPAVRSPLRLLLLASASFGFACATVPPPPVETGELFLWEVARLDGSGGVAHLLGSVHLSEQELSFDPAVDRALASSDTLVLEIDPDDMNPAELASISIEKGHFRDGRTLEEVIAPETWEELEERIDELGLPLEPFRTMEPWLALLTLQMTSLQLEGYDVDKGVETQLASSAVELGKPTQGLETVGEQLDVFDSLPLDLQEQQLREFLEQGPQDNGDLSVLIEAWRRGDDVRIEHELFGELDRDPELAPFFETFYFERNDRMARGIAERVDSGGSWFVAVGAGHVVGARGIPRLLQRQGYRVTRVPKTP
jgi:uncharacterized protein YbaP (TraB family)